MIVTSARETAEAVRDARLTACAHLEHRLAIIDQRNPALNALVHTERALSRERAQLIDRRDPSINRNGSLLGTTFSTRLSLSVAGMPLSNGSLTSEPTISEQNASIVDRLLIQGATCLGKGNIAERGKSYFTENPRYGRTCHPLDQKLSPGGSGGGDAVAVATGMVDFAIGADAGGSVRVPASLCGIYGLSPTHGVLSEAGTAHQSTAIMRLLKSLGILARSLTDIETVFMAAAGFDGHDPLSSMHTLSPLAGPARIRVCHTLNGVSPDAVIRAGIDDVCARFQKIGASIDHTPLPLLESLIEPFVILAAQGQLVLEDTILARNQTPLELDREGPQLQFLRARIGSEMPPLNAQTLLYCWHQIDLARSQMARDFDQFDFLLLPVSASLPVAHNCTTYQVNEQTLRTEQVFQFSTVINALALPAIAVPFSDGTPAGFQLVAPRFGEQRLFSLLKQAGY